MTQHCDVGSAQRLGAIYFHGTLVIWAFGEKPTPCHTVRIRKLPLDIFPPQFRVEFCRSDGQICIQQRTPYNVHEPFLLAPVERVTVHSADGPHEVVVRHTDDPKLTAGDENPALALTLATPGAPETRTSTGYSGAFDFREAFNDAVQGLPPDPHPFPDKLTNVRVVEIGGMYGGIAGFSKLYVRVSTSD